MNGPADSAYDVVVIGAGTAGIPCAISAAQGGARVLLVEKDSLIGGTLHISGGHLAAAGTRRQAERGIEDSPEAHLDDIRRISQGTAREDLIQIVASNAAQTVDWLDERGFAFAAETPRIVYGHEPYHTARTYYGRDEGMSILEVLRAELEKTQAGHDLTLWTNAPVTEIRQDDQGRVRGVTVYREGRDVEIDAPSVVIATGGFSNIFTDELPCIDVYDATLTLKGLQIIAKRNEKTAKCSGRKKGEDKE